MSELTFLEQFADNYAWSQAPAKRRFRFRKRINRSMEEEHRLALTLGGVIDRALDDKEGLQSSDYSTYQIFETNDLVFKLIDLENIKTSRVGYVPRRGIMSPAYIRLQPSSPLTFSRYYYWFFYGAYLNNIFNGMGGGVRQNLTPTDLLEFPIPLPDKETQKSIADFLDRETIRIDQLIKKKQRLIALFGEKRSAVISEATIKGLNPNAEMKNTGIKWLGEVPAHWKVMPIKYLATRSLIDGPHVTPTKVDDGIPFISAESIKSGKINFEKKWGHISEADHKLYSRRYKPQRDDIFVVKLGATTGRVARVETDEGFNIWVPLAAIRPKSEALSMQIFYALQSNQVNDAYQVLWTYGTQQTLGLGTLSNLRLPVPPEAEMDEIARYLKGRLRKIESAIDMTEQSIERLKEYRSALITAAVTGQVDVANWGKQGQADHGIDQIEEALA